MSETLSNSSLFNLNNYFSDKTAFLFCHESSKPAFKHLVPCQKT